MPPEQATADGSSPAGDLVKVRFHLEVEDDGWPPVASEGLWAEPLGEDLYRLANTPWFVTRFSIGDVVRALRDDDGLLWAREGVEYAGRLTVRVIPLPDGPLAGSCDAVIDAFNAIGVSGEGADPAFPIVALDIPGDADFGATLGLLLEGEADGRWGFEEGCVNDRWLSLRSDGAGE